MVNVLIIEAYESYRDNLVEYFELKGCKVYAIDQCSKLFSLFPEILFDIIICDFDQDDAWFKRLQTIH